MDQPPLWTTPVLVALNAILLLVLAFLVIGRRFRANTPFGAGTSPALQRAIRVHANFAEHMPIVLALFASLEILGADPKVLLALGVVVTLGRVAHAAGLARQEGPSVLRAVGSSATWLFLGLGGVWCLVLAWR